MSPAQSQRADARVWPLGWAWNPVRFLFSSANARSVLHAVLLAVLALPVALMTLLGLELLIPSVGRASDDLWRGLAAWRGVRLPRPRDNGVDWRVWLCGCGQALLGVVAGCGLSLLAVLAVAFAAAAVTWAKGWDIFGWYPGDTWARLAMVTLALLDVLLLDAFCWLVSGASTALWARLTLTRTTVDALERSRHLLTDSFAAERRQIERDLHDGVQQYLTATQLAIAAAQVRATGDTEVLAALATAQDNTQRAVTALRSTIRGIYPRALDELGLTEALRELVAHSGLRGTVRVQGLVEDQVLESAAALLLYHSAAEAMTNAVRHGHATSIVVTVTWRDHTVELTVVDDGTGPAGDAPAPGGTGLVGLTERAEALGGGATFEQDNTATGGRLTVWVARRPTTG